MAITDDPEPVWDEPNTVPEEWIETVDENVAAKLPAGSQIKGILKHAKSYWTRTARIETEQADGTPRSFFLKVTQNDVGKAMVFGEFESMKALHSASPAFTPEPIVWGTFAQTDEAHFILCEFIEMTNKLPAIAESMKMLADLHKASPSPTGKYGFHVPTLQGTIPQFTEWTDSWEVFFTKSIKLVFDNEERSQGPDPEVQRLCKETLDKVVPRLLRPLETGGRHITPCLIHGDLWDGNTSTNVATKLPVIYDATCIYAHNEFELAPLRPERHHMRDKYVEAYLEKFPASPPIDDQDDRNALYCLRWDMNCSTLYPGNLRYRRMCVEVMKYLTEKYSDGYEGWAKATGEEPVSGGKKVIYG
ncbi:MAG: hypothetical protein Q9168_004490 [Polycauliona sp. 1 TL-2023]